MNLREKVIFSSGFILAILGIFTTILWTAKAGVVILLLLGFLLLVLVTLQRRQMSKVQQRTLTILQRDKQIISALVTAEQESSMATKRILGVLQAQQISMELLHSGFEETASERKDIKPKERS